MILPKKSTVIINFTYSVSGYPTLFWYGQYSREGPQILLKATKDNEKRISREFEATYHRKSKSFHLKKASVQESDSVVYYCALSDTEKGTAGGAEHTLSSSGAWVLSIRLSDPLCGTVYGVLSLSLWLIQNSYK